MVLQRVDERRLAGERATVPSDSLALSLAHLTAATATSGKQERLAGCDGAALSRYAMPKALGKRPQSPGSTAVLTNNHYYNSAIVTTGLNRGQWTSVWQAKKDFDMTHACNRQVAFWLHSEHHCRSLNWPAINPCKTLRELKTSAGRSLVRHEPCSREVKLRRHCWNWHSRPANPAMPPHEQDKR